MINTYDLDGVVYLGDDYDGIYPGREDIIITGRSIEEAKSTHEMLRLRCIYSHVFFNPIPFSAKTRESSGYHKVNVIKMLIESGYEHGLHFDDDEIQIKIIKELLPNVRVVHVVSDIVEKENVRHD